MDGRYLTSGVSVPDGWPTSPGPSRVDQRLAGQARTEADRGRLLDEVLDVLADPSVPDEQAGRLARTRTGMPGLQAARRAVEDPVPPWSRRTASPRSLTARPRGRGSTPSRSPPATR